jgi:G3E family GTPase
MPRALLVGGTSGRAKEAWLGWVLRGIARRDKASNALLIREIAEPLEIGSEGNVSQFNLQTEYITGGCFCCTSKIDLETILDESHRERSPDNIVIETPITADLMAVKRIVLQIIPGIEVSTLYAMDGETVDVLIDTFPELMRRNLEEADVVALGYSQDRTTISELSLDFMRRPRKAARVRLDDYDFVCLVALPSANPFEFSAWLQ